MINNLLGESDKANRPTRQREKEQRQALVLYNEARRGGVVGVGVERG